MQLVRVVIQNKLGMHARSAAMFVEAANRFQSEILIKRDEIAVNGKSIMGIMMLAAAKGVELTVQATGSDEVEAVQALTDLINSKFGED
ncbi:MAG: HPr family phosphocarrier protein [bacterium]|nr:HPr family phosphocarrier protein [bacterium]